NVILADPLYFPGVVFNSIFNPNQLYLHTYIGAFGTHLYHHLPAWLSIISYAIILYVAVSSERTGVFNIRQRLILLTAFFVAFVFLLATIHLYWDPVGSGYVWLLQGRYLIPLFPLLFIVIGDVFTVSSTQSKWPLFAT